MRSGTRETFNHFVKTVTLPRLIERMSIRILSGTSGVPSYNLVDSMGANRERRGHYYYDDKTKTRVGAFRASQRYQ